MPKFKHYDYNQSAMVVINYEEQLQPGTFAAKGSRGKEVGVI